MELLKLLSANEVVAQLICFLILLFVFKKFAWKPILQILDDRKNKIASEFKKAEDLQSETIKLKADYEQRIKGLEDSARVKIQEAVQEGKRVAEEIKKNAQEESDKLVKSAKQSIQQEISAAETRLREEIVKIAIKAAEDVIEKRYNSDDDKRIVEDFVKNIEKI